jgi:hypothetical protein
VDESKLGEGSPQGARASRGQTTPKRTMPEKMQLRANEVKAPQMQTGGKTAADRKPQSSQPLLTGEKGRPMAKIQNTSKTTPATESAMFSSTKSSTKLFRNVSKTTPTTESATPATASGVVPSDLMLASPLRTTFSSTSTSSDLTLASPLKTRKHIRANPISIAKTRNERRAAARFRERQEM